MEKTDFRTKELHRVRPSDIVKGAYLEVGWARRFTDKDLHKIVAIDFKTFTVVTLEAGKSTRTWFCNPYTKIYVKRKEAKR